MALLVRLMSGLKVQNSRSLSKGYILMDFWFTCSRISCALSYSCLKRSSDLFFLEASLELLVSMVGEKVQFATSARTCSFRALSSLPRCSSHRFIIIYLLFVVLRLIIGRKVASFMY